MTREAREHWGSKLGFIMAAAGSAIGLGSLWRFPYVTATNGGGLFVLAYIFFTFAVSLPIFIAELIIGRRAQRGPVDALTSMSCNTGPWRNISWLCVITNFIILSFYSVISGWSLHYLILSLQDFTAQRTAEEISALFDRFYVASDLNIFWLGMFLALSAAVVLGGIKKGIELWASILTPGLFVLMLCLLLYCSSLSGFWPALEFLFRPDWSHFSSTGVLEALGMAFFTLSVGLGILITYGSYMQPTQSIPSTAITVAVLNVCVSLIASMIIFPLIFTFNMQPDQGPGLVFKILPVLFNQLPATKLLSTLFFLILLLTAITSSISILETLATTGMEAWGWSRRKSVFIWSTAGFFLGLPSALAGSGLLLPNWTSIYGTDFLSQINALPDWMLTIGALAFAFFVGWTLKPEIVEQEYKKASSALSLKFFPLWIALVRYFVPLAIISIVLHKLGIFQLLSC